MWFIRTKMTIFASRLSNKLSPANSWKRDIWLSLVNFGTRHTLSETEVFDTSRIGAADAGLKVNSNKLVPIVADCWVYYQDPSDTSLKNASPGANRMLVLSQNFQNDHRLRSRRCRMDPNSIRIGGVWWHLIPEVLCDGFHLWILWAPIWQWPQALLARTC